MTEPNSIPNTVQDSVQNFAIRTASLVWSGMSGMARVGIRTGLVRPAGLGCRVISVGNIQIGGAGKTPLVARIAQEAAERGLKVCILSRGYRGNWESSGGVLLPGEIARVDDCGDEPALLRDLCPKAYLGIGHDRVKQYHAVLDRSGQRMDLVILDDGFQNWRIKKDLDIVAITSATPSKIIFRDSVRALSHADLIVWTKGEKRPVVPNRLLVKMVYRIPPSPEAKSYWLVTGLADGESAKRLASQSGYRIVRHIAEVDHAAYTAEFVQKIMEEASTQGARIAMTGKDWVKWREFGVPAEQVTVLEPKLEILEGQDLWAKLLWGVGGNST